MEKIKSSLSIVKTISGLLCSLFVLSVSIVLFIYSPTIINRIEIQKDYISHPILSISNIKNESPLSFTTSSSSHSKKMILLYDATLDGTPLSFTYYDSTYESLLTSSVKKGEPCPDNTKQCGILDTLGNIMCIDVNTDCPINLILMTEDNNIPSEYKYTFTTVKLNNTYLHYTNEAINNPILVKFIHFNYNSVEIFPFIKTANEYWDSYEYDSYYVGNLTPSYFTKYFPITKPYSFRPYIGRQYQCLPSDFYNIEKFHESFISNSNKHVTFCMLSLALFGEIVIGWAYDYEDFLEDPTKGKNKNFIICLVIFVIIHIPTLIYNILAMISCNNLLIHNFCFDDETNQLIELFQSENRTIYLILGIISICVLIFLLIHFIFSGIYIIKFANQTMKENEGESKEKLVSETLTPDTPTPLQSINN